MLNFLSTNKQKTTVGLALTPGIGLEAVIYNHDKQVVEKYGRKKVDYNFSTREIQDYVQFKTAVSELMDELDVPPKSLIYVVLPNIYFDFMEIPPSIGEEEIKTILLSQSEEFYIFKKEEPVPGWCETINPDSAKQRKIVYSPFQKSTVDDLKNVISDLGMQIIGVENSYSATLRGLKLAGLVEDVVAADAYWTAMIIGTNSYTLFHMYGKNILECNEVPLAIRSFSVEEAYQAIVSSTGQLLVNFPAAKLYVISQTDEICADVLCKQMGFEREIVPIDLNKFAKQPLLDVIETENAVTANSLTLAALGASYTKTDFGMVMNALADDPDANTGVYFTTTILGTTVDVTAEIARTFCIFICTVILAICAVIYLLLFIVNSKAESDIDYAGNKLTTIEKEIQKESEGKQDHEIDMMSIINEVAELNVTAVNFYDSIATDIPKNIWLTKYYNKAGDKIAVQGIAESINDIYEYYKNLRVISPKSNIKLTELKVVTDEEYKALSINSEAGRLYSFEIANTQIDYDKLNKQPGAGQDDDTDFVIIKKSGSSAPQQQPGEQPPVEEPPVEQPPVEQPAEQMQPTE